MAADVAWVEVPIVTAPTPRKSPLPWILLGLGVGAALIALGVVALLVVVDDDGPLASSPEIVRLAPGGGAVPVPGEDELITLVDTYGDDGSGTHVVRADYAGDELWRSPLEVDSGDRVLGLVGDAVLVELSRGRLAALDLDDGSERWTAFAAVEPSCAACIQVVGDVLLLRNAEGDLTALDPATGQEAWSRPGRIDLGSLLEPVVVDDAVVVGEVQPDGEGHELVVLDAADGRERNRIAPACRTTVDGQPHDEVLQDDSLLVAVRGADDVAVVFGYDGRCVQRWPLDASEPAWESALDVGWAALGAVASEEQLAFSAEGALVLVELDDGAHRVLPVAPEHSPAPLAFVGGAVVADVVPDLGAGAGTRHVAGWSLADPEDGSWTVPASIDGSYVRADGLRLGGSGVTDESGLGVLVPGGDDLRLLTVLPRQRGDLPQLRITDVDPLTGRVADERLVTLEHDPEELDLALLSVDAVADGRAALTVTDVPQLVDLATGEVTAAWPVPD